VQQRYCTRGAGKAFQVAAAAPVADLSTRPSSQAADPTRYRAGWELQIEHASMTTPRAMLTTTQALVASEMTMQACTTDPQSNRGFHTCTAWSAAPSTICHRGAAPPPPKHHMQLLSTSNASKQVTSAPSATCFGAGALASVAHPQTRAPNNSASILKVPHLHRLVCCSLHHLPQRRHLAISSTPTSSSLSNSHYCCSRSSLSSSRHSCCCLLCCWCYCFCCCSDS
jgi:hypothetical protein